MIDFFIKGTPIAQGRPRARIFGKRVIMYDPKTSKDWKVEVRRQGNEHAETMDNPVMDGALRMSLWFYMLRPKSLPKRVVHHVKKPDCDNLAKGVKDALQGVFYNNDSQICDLRIRKVYCDEHPGVRVQIEYKEEM